MAFNNPYREKIKDHNYIISDTETIKKYKGKWAKDHFQNSYPLRLEIGTGLGNFFSGEVTKYPNTNFLGMEIKYKRCYMTAEKTLHKGGKNFLVIKEFAQKINDFIADGELEQIYIFFPDPWGKKERQKKHRLMQADFLEILYKKTQEGGKVIFKTDHKSYFDDTLDILKKQNIWNISKISFDYENEIEEFDIKNLTEFESMHREHKTKINYLELLKH